jgi:hypothetical protein
MSDLQELIATLERMPRSAPLTCGWRSHPGKLGSYRGYYDHLAIEPVDNPTTVGDFLKQAKAAVGKTFQGYKGGDYKMAGYTPVWVSPYGEVSGRRFIGVVFDGETVRLLSRDES